jgi:Asp-tRNA(Asn)/Glu-tRNA(Gln) amidotransferase A subunit family amidase
MPHHDDPATWNAQEAASAIACRQLSSRALVQACLDRIADCDEPIQAWTCLEPEQALRQADACDRAVLSGRPLGRLHGVPVAIKDNIDTADMPTAYGTPLYAGHRPQHDATVVQRLRAQGAVILGKTVTTELAYFTPGKTRNPHNPLHTPGGSSSGSAAAVASGMVPLALGTQTNGSVIRPAAFCGTLGYKPSFGWISRHGVLLTSQSLDQVGIFGRTLDDVALAASCLIAQDPGDEATASAPQALSLSTRWTAAQHPRVAWLESTLNALADTGFLAQLSGWAASLQDACRVVDLGDQVAQANAHQKTIMHVEMAANLGHLHDRAASQLSEPLRALIEDGRRTSRTAYLDSLNASQQIGRDMDALFDRCDVLMLPSAPGPAPRGLDSTGSPVFCSLASLLGLPAISLPLFTDDSGLPLGVQLVARRGQDQTLLQAAGWLMRRRASETPAPMPDKA